MKWISIYRIRINNYIIHIVNLTLLLFIFRGSIPAFKYPFILLYAFVIVNFVFTKKVRLHDVRLFMKSYLLIILLVLYFSVALLSTYKLYLEIFKELINTLILLSITYIYTIIVNTERQIKTALSNLVDWVIMLSAFIAVVWIFDFFSIYLPNNDGVRLLDYQIVDYNFATIPALFGIVSILLKLPGPITKAKQYLLTFLLLLLYFQVFLSTSRRSFIIAITISIVVFVVYVISFFVRKGWISNFARSITPFLLIIVAIVLSGYLFVKQTTYDYKTVLFKKMGIVNGIALTDEITEKYLKFINIFDPKKTISELYEEIWAPNLDPKDPESGWGRKIHKTIYPLSGKNSNLIPEGVKGYLMDNTCNAYFFEGNSYSITNVDMETHSALENDTVKSTIFCFVSEDYDGDYVYMVLSVNDGASIRYAHFDLDNKGIWQELNILMPVSSGRVSTHIYFRKTGASSFSNLKGHVIFAYPQFTNISQLKRASIEGNGNTLMPEESSLRNYSRESNIGYEYLIKSSSINPISSLSLISRFPGGDPIRNLMIRLFPKDTTYLKYKSDLQVDPFSNIPGEDRILRWKFAWQIFRLEYNWTQRFFGGGFSFLNWYGYYFTHDKTQSDWPHNPFLSILLYSGIVGLFIYLFFMYKVFYYYIKYKKEYPLLFIFFIITFFFSFFSGGSPFDPPIMGFFSILPFFIHAVHKRDDRKMSIQTQFESNKLFWDNYSDEFDAIYGTKNTTFNSLINKWFRKTIKIRFDKTIIAIPADKVSVLDIGCGPGHYCFALAKKVTGEILGIDFSQNMINLAIGHAGELNIEHKIEFMVEDILKFNPAKKYDYAIMMGFIEYFEEPEAILKHALTLTNKKLFISFPVAGGILAFQRKLRYRRRCFLKLYHYKEIADLMDRLNVKSYNIERIQRDFFVTITLS